ncbi:AMP-binding protein [Neobacillus sp. NPDC093182]|uniref:AMP-binding protein n=1 Tax=Neobacillus sp. NPDC093182 TaxID=3364297 RepID=UPI003826056E
MGNLIVTTDRYNQLIKKEGEIVVRWELDWLANRARLTPNRERIIDAEQKKQWTFAELNQICEHTANWLYKEGVRKGERVALLAPNDISYFQLICACLKLGAVFVPINWRLIAIVLLIR